jgi:hypothetical protein
MNTLDFFYALYPEINNNTILIWDNLRTSHWCASQQEAVDAALHGSSKGREMYFGLGLAPYHKNGNKRSVNKRAEIDEIVTIPGVWADIDVVAGAHDSKKRYPETMEQVYNLLKLLPLYPTMVVETGGGVHAYWLFDKMFKCEEENMHFEAQNMVFRWQSLIRKIFHEYGGYTIDSTADLARILRVPGTLNHKYQPAREVSITKYDAPLIRYQASKINSILDYHHISESKKKKPNGTGTLAKLNLPNSMEEMTTERRDAIFEADPRIRNAWSMPAKTLRADGTQPDNSMSAWDMTIANYAVKLGLTDEEIFLLLLRFRTDHGEDVKHRGYYQTTISKAHQNLVSASAHDYIDNVVVNVTTAEGDPDEFSDKDILRNLTETLQLSKFPIQGIYCLKAEPYIYTVRCLNLPKDITIGDISCLTSEQKFRLQIAEATRILPPKQGKKWEGLAQAMLHIAQDVEMGKEATEAGMHTVLLREYIAEKRIGEYNYASIRSRKPFTKEDGFVYFMSSEYKMWAKHQKDVIFTERKLYIGLRSAGAEPYELNWQFDGNGKGRKSYWRINENIIHIP